jgi:hypothetical protein
VHEVQLLGVPVRLLVDGRERHDELMREFSLLALSAERARADVPTRLVELTDILGVRYAGSTDRPDAVVDAAMAEGLDTVDLTYRVPAEVVVGADMLDTLMAEADEFCRAEQLLTLARSDLQLRFSNWYLDEFRRQIAGEPPQPWDGPLDP